MAAPFTTTTGRFTDDREEGFLHYLAREGRTALHWLIGICLVAIVICMVTIWFAAIVPAVILVASYALLVLANEVEKRSDTEAHAQLEAREVAVIGDVVEDHAEDHQLEPVQAHLVQRESKTGMVIIGAALVAATLIAFIVFDLRLLAIGALVMFSYMIFIAAPFWLGWFNDDIEDETRRLEGVGQSARVRT